MIYWKDEPFPFEGQWDRIIEWLQTPYHQCTEEQKSLRPQLLALAAEMDKVRTDYHAITEQYHNHFYAIQKELTRDGYPGQVADAFSGIQ